MDGDGNGDKGWEIGRQVKRVSDKWREDMGSLQS